MPKGKVKKIITTKKAKKTTRKSVKSSIKKTNKDKSKIKPPKTHVKSFYRPRTVHVNIVKNEDKLDTKIEQMIWVPVALVLAITSIGLNMMLVIYYNYR